MKNLSEQNLYGLRSTINKDLAEYTEKIKTDPENLKCEHAQCQHHVAEIYRKILMYQAIMYELSKLQHCSPPIDRQMALDKVNKRVQMMPLIEHYEPANYCHVTESTYILASSLNDITQSLLQEYIRSLIIQKGSPDDSEGIPLKLSNIQTGFWGHTVDDPYKGEYFTLL